MVGRACDWGTMVVPVDEFEDDQKWIRYMGVGGGSAAKGQWYPSRERSQSREMDMGRSLRRIATRILSIRICFH